MVQTNLTTKQKTVNRGGLVALVGLLAASVLYTATPKEEGTEYKAYKDIAGIWTICNGDTKNVTPNMRETPAGCQVRLEKQLVAHAGPVMECTPTLAQDGKDYQRAAFVLNAYNIGTARFCKSSMAVEARRGRWVAACNALAMYDKARVQGVLRPVKGLTLRRKREIEICLTGITPDRTPANLAKRVNSVR